MGTSENKKGFVNSMGMRLSAEYIEQLELVPHRIQEKITEIVGQMSDSDLMKLDGDFQDYENQYTAESELRESIKEEFIRRDIERVATEE